MSVLNKKGVTLLELILVFSLIAIISAIALPRTNRLPYFMKSYGRTLCADIRYIRLAKMTEGGEFRILLHSRYYRVLNGHKELKTIELPKNLELVFSGSEVRFDYKGSPSHGGTTITIRDRDSAKFYQITIVPASGRVLLKDEIQSP